MACNSVATTSAQITKVILSKDDLRGIVAKMLKIDLSKVRDVSYSSEYLRAYAQIDGITYTVEQILGDGKAQVYFRASDTTGNLTQAKLDAKIKPIQEDYDKLLIVAQQTNVLKRLAQLGKLSNVTGKDRGVVAKLEITI